VKIAVAGLWHLGTVTAGCLAAIGHDVVAYDNDQTIVEDFAENRLPVAEPGLLDLVRAAKSRGKLKFTWNAADLASSEVIWVCFETPLDEKDVADVNFVHDQVMQLLPRLGDGTMVLISSQVPVGSTARLEAAYSRLPERHRISFAYSPENLRLGNAIEAFAKADRIVVGTRLDRDRERLRQLLSPLTKEICWMSIESAEMTKHALNAFLATSIAFINEIAAICEETSADAREVERGLKTDSRIGRRAYLHAGGAFTGGTLARDLQFLLKLAEDRGVSAQLLSGVRRSNESHKSWVQRRVLELIDDLPHSTVAVLGLTYKPGTNTLRRSGAVEFCHWAVAQGAEVTAFDPAVRELPSELAFIRLKNSVAEALHGAHAALIATTWPEFLDLGADAFADNMRRPIVIDPSRFLEHKLARDSYIEYIGFGKGNEVS